MFLSLGPHTHNKLFVDELYQEQASSTVTSRAHQGYFPAVMGVMGYSLL